MANGISPENSPTSSSTDQNTDETVCKICGGEPICQGLGMIRYDVPVGDPRFGKMYRCPHNRVDRDLDRQQILRKLSNLDAFVDKTFDNFDISPGTLSVTEQGSLRIAFDKARRFAQHPTGWLLLEGTYGCGKTHLAAAIGNWRLREGDSVLFITTPDLLDHLRSAYGPSSEMGYDETFDRVRNAPVLILDDLGVENPSSWAEEKLFQLLNYRYSHNKPTVITTNADLDNLDERIRSRLLDENLMQRVVINAPDYRSTVQNERHQLLSNLALYREMTFESFDAYTNLTSEEQKNLMEAYRVALEYARSPRGWLVLTGPFGCGKTHLAAAIAHYQQDQNHNVMFITVPDLLDYLRITFSPGSNVSFDQRFQAVRSAPLLVLDDLGMESASSWAKEKLFQIIDHRYVAKLPTVITTSKEIEEINARIVSRILDERRCLIFAITGPGYALRQNRRR